MLTTQTAAPTRAHEGLAAHPLVLHAVPASRRRNLAATVRQVEPIRRDVLSGPRRPRDARRLAREAVADRRTTRERVLDRVVDGLIAELTR